MNRLIVPMISLLAGCRSNPGRLPASAVTCTASCVLDRTVVTVQSTGLDTQDALPKLKKRCDKAGQQAKSQSHFLATSVAKPNQAQTSNQTEFDASRACL